MADTLPIDLRGAKGVVFLLFLSGPTTAFKLKKIPNLLIKEKDKLAILRDPTTVDAYARELEKAKLIQGKKDRTRPGHPVMRTADKDVVFTTFEKHGIRLSAVQKAWVMFLLQESRSDLVFDSFPGFLITECSNYKIMPETLRWNETLSFFLAFIGFTLAQYKPLNPYSLKGVHVEDVMERITRERTVKAPLERVREFIRRTKNRQLAMLPFYLAMELPAPAGMNFVFEQLREDPGLTKEELEKILSGID